MLTLRLSLDAMTPENGPLVVLPGSHSVLSAERLATAGEADSDLAQLASSEVRTILCQPGDIFVMRPLLAHSSLLSTKNCLWRRRVLHLELSAVGELPPGFDWFEFAEV